MSNRLGEIPFTAAAPMTIGSSTATVPVLETNPERTPPNFVAAGGYEGKHQRFASRDVLKLVETARDGLFDLHAELWPEASEGGEEYPDCVELPLVAE